MGDTGSDYLFHVHRHLPAWRLVLRKDGAVPPGCVAGDWRFTRARTAQDTNPDVRHAVDTDGFCLFRLGGRFAEVAAEMAAHDGGPTGAPEAGTRQKF
jgi:hypothetical protein